MDQSGWCMKVTLAKPRILAAFRASPSRIRRAFSRGRCLRPNSPEVRKTPTTRSPRTPKQAVAFRATNVTGVFDRFPIHQRLDLFTEIGPRRAGHHQAQTESPRGLDGLTRPFARNKPPQVTHIVLRLGPEGELRDID